MKTISVGRASLIACALTTVAACLSLAPGTLTVNTAGGTVHGKQINDGKVLAFLGIPYAAPPMGSLRWKAPQPAASWSSERDATQYGHRCAQGHEFEDMVFQDGEATEFGSEDCLTLNVYAPSPRHDGAKLPVMFWIHGGGYVGGSASERRHDGDFLPLKGVVLVTINYRLGIFGFLSLPELTAEQGGSSGNYGLMDMVAALSWVKNNIAAFGGDPDRVTIFGESAGSYAVSTLMAAPSAQGLFHRAIGESGGALDFGSLSMESAAAAGAKNAVWAKEAGAAGLADLRAMPVDRILSATTKENGIRFRPVIDGRFLKESVLDSYNAGKQAKIPLLAGFNRDEGSAAGMTAKKWQSTAKENFAGQAEAFVQLYPGPTDAMAARSAADFNGDKFIAYATWKWMEVDRKTGDSNIYRYRLDLPAPPSKFHPGSYAFHSDDIEYVFGTLDTRPGAAWRPEDYALSDQIMSYWTNFAKRGDPNGVGSQGQPLPHWPRYAAGDPVLHLDNPTAARPDENRGRYEFWQNLDLAASQSPQNAAARAHIAAVEKIVVNLPDKGAAFYYLAALYQQLGETRKAAALLEKCLALREGFDPSASTQFAPIIQDSATLSTAIAQVHADFPMVSRARAAYETSERDLMPEGLAYDEGRNTFYLSSLNRRKIVKIHEGTVSDFVPAGREDLLPVLGIRVNHIDGSIWANSWSQDAERSELLHFSSSGILLGRYAVKDAVKHGFNDLIIGGDGAILLTDTLADQVWRFDPMTETFSAIAFHRPLFEPNGITLDDSRRRLFVADDLGVVRMDISGGASVDVDPGQATLAGVDGLYWHRGRLIAIQNGIGVPRIAAFKLTADGTRVAELTVLENRSSYMSEVPTTGAIRGRDFYFIVNSQIENLQGDRVADPSKLATVRIGVLRLP